MVKKKNLQHLLVVKQGNIILPGLKNSCRQAKTPATDCCQNPSACSSVIEGFATHILPALPGLYATFKGIKLNKEITSSELTTEEIQNKLCSMNNRTQMASFTGGLLSQLMPALQQGCAGKIKRCQKLCNNEVKKFNSDFVEAYRLVTIGEKEVDLGVNDSRGLINLAKTCLFGHPKTPVSLNNISFNPDTVDVNNPIIQSVQSDITGNCYWDNDAYKILMSSDQKRDILKNDHLMGRKTERQIESIPESHLSSILFAAKAYYNTMGVKPEVRKTGRSESFQFKEKEIVDCGYQPDRKISKRYTPGGPVPPPVMQACRAAVKEAVDQHKTPGRTPTAASAGPEATTGESGMGGAETFVATKTDKSDPNPLLWGPGKGPNQPGLEDFDDPEERPSPPSKLASFGDSSNSGSSPGGGPGGGGLSPGGGGGGPMEDYPYGSDMYAGGVGELSGGFSDSSGYDAAGGYQEATTGEDPIALAQADDTEKDGFGTPDFGVGNYPGGAQDPSSEKTIFGMSSERIQNFCADRTCID